jgi:hypothetical protein
VRDRRDLPEPLRRHVDDLVACAQEGLAGGLVAAYVIGSRAAGDAHPNVSDLDLLLACAADLPRGARLALGHDLARIGGAGPTRGVEAVLYRTEVLATPTYPLVYELNVNSGPAVEHKVETEGTEPFWFLLDVAIAREQALVVHGAPADRIIGPVAHQHVVAALVDALRWHAAGDVGSPDAVLNACRAWYWLEHRVWRSKTAAGRWARSRTDHRELVDAAVAARRAGSDEGLDADAARELLRMVLARAERASRRDH